MCEVAREETALSRPLIRRMLVALAVLLALCLPASAGADQARTTALGGIYRGNDGSVLYLRAVGANVFGFGEHPGRGYAYALIGTFTGQRINAQWWDLPKGTRNQAGAFALQTSSEGVRMVRSVGTSPGPDVFTQLPANASIPWAGKLEAGFQSKAATDLDGAFRGSDNSTHYVREEGSRLVWFAERIPQLGARPTWSTLFVGSASGTDAFQGTWIDLPKGQTAGFGNFAAGRVRIDRSIALLQQGIQGAPRANMLWPDWALDMDAYVSTMNAALAGNVVGYAFAVAKHGDVVRAVAGGSRRLAQDGGVLPFTRYTQNSSASTTKLVTATALMHLLAKKKLPVTKRVLPYLPSCWKKSGVDMRRLTFRNLLDHSSRIDRALGGTACADNPYECIRRSLEAGQSGSPGYDNINYTSLRYLLPLVEDYQSTNAIFARFGCGETQGAPSRVRAAQINSLVSRRFERYVQDEVLKPHGIVAGYSTSGDDWAFGYDFQRQSARGSPPDERALATGGSGGMKWSADAYTRFLAALDGGKIVSPAVVRQMKAQLLGYDRAVAGAAGGYYTKNGAAGNFESRAMVYPGRVVAYVTLNSRNNQGSPNLQSLLRSAFDAALR